MTEKLTVLIMLLAACLCAGCTPEPEPTPAPAPVPADERSVLKENPCDCDKLAKWPGSNITPLYWVRVKVVRADDDGRLIHEFSVNRAEGQPDLTAAQICDALEKGKEFASNKPTGEPRLAPVFSSDVEAAKRANGDAPLWEPK
jgi:hypothetical protein